jgi:hypothetical protein
MNSPERPQHRSQDRQGKRGDGKRDNRRPIRRALVLSIACHDRFAGSLVSWLGRRRVQPQRQSIGGNDGRNGEQRNRDDHGNLPNERISSGSRPDSIASSAAICLL